MFNADLKEGFACFGYLMMKELEEMDSIKPKGFVVYSEGEFPDHEACRAFDRLASSRSTFSSQLKWPFLGEASLGDSKGLREERLPIGLITQHLVLLLQRLSCCAVDLFNIYLLL